MNILSLITLLAIVVVGVWWGLEAEPGSEPPSASEAADETVLSAVGSVVVYDGISVAKNETELDLSGRGLSGSLKAEVRQLSELEVLDLSNNNFTGLPAEVGQLSKLKVLNLSNNPLTGLPYELGNLSNLEVLDLRGTQYAEADLQVITQSLPKQVTILTN